MRNILIIILIFLPVLSASGLGFGIGISTDLSLIRNIDVTAYFSALLNFGRNKEGLFSITADIGYKFISRDLSGKTGIEIFLFSIGINLSYMYFYEFENNNFYSGGNLSIFVIPGQQDYVSIYMGVGVSGYFKNTAQLEIGIRVLYTNIKYFKFWTNLFFVRHSLPPVSSLKNEYRE